MLEIRRRYNTNDWETIAYYEDGEFRGDSDFVEAFKSLEGAPEDTILEEFDGPNTLAVRPEDAPDADATAIPDEQ